MLLNTMTDVEIFNEIKKDYRSCKEKINYYHGKFAKSVKNKFCFNADTYKMTSPNNNEWITFYFHSKTPNGWEIYYKHYVFMRNMDGTYKVLSINIENNDVQTITIFSAHFFQRYKERFCNNKQYAFKDLFLMFLLKNPYFLSVQTKEGGYTVMNEGVGLVNFGSTPNVCYVNTFITKDMLKPKQLAELNFIL